jgi:hypothetical protein
MENLHTVSIDTFSPLNSFLDKAAVILWNERDGSHDPWRLCTVTQIEELKILLRMFPIWATGIVFFTVCAQNSSMFIEQGMTLNNRIGSFKIPPATLSSLDVISVVVWVPIYEPGDSLEKREVSQSFNEWESVYLCLQLQWQLQH